MLGCLNAHRSNKCTMCLEQGVLQMIICEDYSVIPWLWIIMGNVSITKWSKCFCEHNILILLIQIHTKRILMLNGHVKMSI